MYVCTKHIYLYRIIHVHILTHPSRICVFLFLYVPLLNDFRSKLHVKFSGETAETPNNTYTYKRTACATDFLILV